jgi:hypothetical protein
MRTTTGDWSLRRRDPWRRIGEIAVAPLHQRHKRNAEFAAFLSEVVFEALGPFAVADVAEHTGADETVQAVGEHVARDPKTLEQLIEAMASDPYVAFAPPSGKCWRLRASPWRSTRRG